MLKFFKKSGQKETVNAESTSPVRTAVSSYVGPRYEANGVSAPPNPGPVAQLSDEGFDIDEFEASKDRSRLSKTLGEVLVDKSALGYFIQFIELQNALPYVRCWLDVENFQTAVQCSRKDDNRSLSTKVDHDSLSVSTDCDSFTADSSSLCEFSSATISDKQTSRAEVTNKHCDRDSETSPRCNGDESPSRFVQEFTDDALRIFKKYVALEAPENVHCSEQIRKDVIENICSTEKIMKSPCFKDVQEHVCSVLDKEYFEAFLGSDYYCKYQIDVLTSGNIVLEDILYNETALFYFMEFLEQENNRNILEFWLAASNFHQQLHVQKDFFDPNEAQYDAVILYDKYFSLQALCPLGFGDKVRFAVEQNICGENGLTPDCFHLPLKIIESVLEKQYLKPFLASQLFYKYLSELINTVQSNGYSLYYKSRHISSDCSSERSFCTNSTFLALEIPTKPKKKDKKATDMNIDTRQLYDPDSLWKRKKFHRLSFGRVTEMGKFLTDFEPEPDKRSQSKLRNVVKKFVSLEEDKKKEDMAWQVAEMIVKDITNVTLSEQKT